jgi:hypothetical protein
LTFERRWIRPRGKEWEKEKAISTNRRPFSQAFMGLDHLQRGAQKCGRLSLKIVGLKQFQYLPSRSGFVQGVHVGYDFPSEGGLEVGSEGENPRYHVGGFGENHEL